MIAFPNAKINLGLNIISKRPDGYHNIETVFYPIDTCDVLEIVPSKDGMTHFFQMGMPEEEDPQKNLVMKAYRLLESHYALPPLDIYLDKYIPLGAGLGGGSADAAFMLRLLNDFAELNLSSEQLEEYAGQLGADCAFFIRNQPVFAEGIGTILTPISLSLKKYRIALIKPDVHVSTQEAYAHVKPQQPKERIMDVLQLPVNEWKGRLINDFEASVFARYPQIEEIKQRMYDDGALYASMSGSGSSVFGIF